jgi:hypothetical protein
VRWIGKREETPKAFRKFLEWFHDITDDLEVFEIISCIYDRYQKVLEQHQYIPEDHRTSGRQDPNGAT